MEQHYQLVPGATRVRGEQLVQAVHLQAGPMRGTDARTAEPEPSGVAGPQRCERDIAAGRHLQSGFCVNLKTFNDEIYISI